MEDRRHQHLARSRASVIPNLTRRQPRERVQLRGSVLGSRVSYANGFANALRTNLGDDAIALIQSAHPVDSLYLSFSATNPASTIGYGTWVLVSEGKFIVGVDAADPDFNAPGDTGGTKTHTHADHASHTHLTNVTVDAHGTHTHLVTSAVTVDRHDYFEDALLNLGVGADPVLVGPISGHVVGNPAVTSAAGGPTTHTVNNPASAGPSATLSHAAASSLPPFFAAYIWRRTA